MTLKQGFVMPQYITGLDLETTGLSFAKGDRIIEVNLQVFRLENRKKMINFTQRINNDGKAINKKAQEVHHISAADLIGKPMFKEVAPKINKILERSVAVVTHNGNWFDLPFLAFEMAQVKLELPTHIQSFDTMREGKFASYDSKMPSLKELCWAMGVEYDVTKAHAAEYDVSVMMDSFFRAVDRGLFTIDNLTTAASA